MADEEIRQEFVVLIASVRETNDSIRKTLRRPKPKEHETCAEHSHNLRFNEAIEELARLKRKMEARKESTRNPNGDKAQQ